MTGATTFTGAASGPGTAPIGSSVLWWSDTLPSGFGTWGFCNGQSLDRTTFAALFAILGTTYGAVDGSHFNVPDLRERTPVGKSTMGGASSPGLIPQYTTSALATQIGEGRHTLTTGEIPTGLFTLNFSDPSHSHAQQSNTYLNAAGSTAPVAAGGLDADRWNTPGGFSTEHLRKPHGPRWGRRAQRRPARCHL